MQNKLFIGRAEESEAHVLEALRLSPRDPRLPNWFWRIGMVHLLQSRTDEAIPWLERARNTNPRLVGPHAWLASAYALNGDLPRSIMELAETRRLNRDNIYTTIAAHKAARWFGAASNYALAEQTFFAGLRRAGVSEQ